MRQLLLLIVVLAGARAGAVGLGLDVGAGSWVLEAPQADVHLRVEQELFDFLKLGARPGLTLTLNEPNARLGFPVDLYAHFKLAIVYLELLGGALFIPSSVEPVRGHLGAGVGFEIWKLQFGFEVAYLQPSVNVLGRVGFTFF